MNAGSIVNMVVRMIMRQVMRKGVNAGIDAVGKRMNKGRQDNEYETGKHSQQSPDPNKTQKRLKQSIRVTRKMGRF